MSLLSLNGGCVVAMRGKECVAIASDHRFGVHSQTISADVPKLFEVNPRMYMGLTGLLTDVLTLRDRVLCRKQLFEQHERCEMEPLPFASLLSNLLYEHRFAPFYVEPVIAGLDPKTMEPFICSMDLLGSRNHTDDFVVAGTCADQLYGMCEALWKPNLEPEQIFEVISQVLTNAFNRDALSGLGATVLVIDKEKITTKELKCRMD